MHPYYAQISDKFYQHQLTAISQNQTTDSHFTNQMAEMLTKRTRYMCMWYSVGLYM